MYRLLLLALIAALSFVTISAQEVDETIKIKTRVVFLDALVKDKKTSRPISNLSSRKLRSARRRKTTPDLLLHARRSGS